MGLFSERKPYTAISAEMEALLNRGIELEPARLLNLVELIQGTRPADAGGHEAGRLLRKRVKHGSPAEQARALQLVETLVDNGIKTGPLVAESGLGEQLTQLAGSHAQGGSAAKAVRQCRSLLKEWSTRRDKHISSLGASAGIGGRGSGAADDHHEHHHHSRSRSRNSFHPDDDLDDEVFGEDAGHGRGHARSHSGNHLASPSGSHSRSHSRSLSGSHSGSHSGGHSGSHARSRSRSGHARSPSSASAGGGGGGGGARSRSPSPINLRGASIDTVIATAHNIATRLTTALIEAPSGSRETRTYYRQAKQLRHRVVKLVHDPHNDVQAFVGQLLAANEELVAALQAHDAVVEDGEPLAAQDDHDLLDLGDTKPAAAAHTRPPPSPPRAAASPGSSPELAAEPDDSFDPFADDNEQNERPKHTPLW